MGVQIFYLIIGFSAVYGDFDLVVLHTNDVHARIEQTNKYSANCSEKDTLADKCYGGVARLHTVVQKIRQKYSNVLFLDGGDHFQGSIWFTYYAGLSASYFMNQLGYEAMALGNHEFDNGPSGLASPFLENVTFPVVACNVQSEAIQDLIEDYTILNVSGQRIGVVGYITQLTAILADPATVEGVTFTDVVTCVQESVSKLQSLGVNKIIAIGHAGMKKGIEVAEKVPGLDLVIEGHSNAFLYNGDPPSIEVPYGPYPVVATQASGIQVPVVSAYAYSKYLGMLELTFNDDGDVIEWSGNAILLDKRFKQDPNILAQVARWREPIVAFSAEQLGTTYVLLDANNAVCRFSECNIGNVVTDAVLFDNLVEPTDDDSWSDVGIAMWNGGGIRGSVENGPINLAQVFEVLPFRNEIVKIWVKGKTLKSALEHSVTDWNPQEPAGRFLQFSGLKVSYNIEKPEGQRVHSVSVRCTQCQVPKYVPLEMETEYVILTAAYLVGGGDGYSVLKNNLIREEYIGTLVADALSNYLKAKSPIIQGIEGRISFVEEQLTDNAATSNNIKTLLLIFCILFSASY